MALDQMKRSFEYYLAHQAEFAQKYNERVIVLSGEAVVGDFESELEAAEFAKRTMKPGEFLVQRVSLDDRYTSRTFRSRVGTPA